MHIKSVLAAAVAAGVLAAAGSASATINSPIPSNAYITMNGLDWAWGSPLPDASGNLSYQSTLGWRLPTDQELLSAPTAMDFLFDGANVPFQGVDPNSGATFSVPTSDYIAAESAGACASPYFASGYSHCDFVNGNGQSQGPWASSNNQGYADQLYVRTAAVVTPGVPEPATWLTMILGFGGIGAMMRRRRGLVAV